MVFVSAPESVVAVLTAVTVTVPVTLAVSELEEVELLLPPPQPVMTTAEHTSNAPSGRRPCFLTAKKAALKPSVRALSKKRRPPPFGEPGGQNAVEVVEFAIVRVALPDPVTVPGMAQVIFVNVEGTEQENETVPENPPTALTFTVDVPDEESWTVREDGLMESVNVGA